MSDLVEQRRQELRELGASERQIAALLAYNQIDTDLDQLLRMALPLPDEPQVRAWPAEGTLTGRADAWQELRRRFAGMHFPVGEGVNTSDAYRRAARRGEFPPDEGRGLVLEAELRLSLHPTAAGRIPVVTAGCRGDFVTLVQALAYRNEPRSIPESMGAILIGGLTDWDRVAQHRRAWEKRQGEPANAAAWSTEFSSFSKQKELYQDRLMVLSCGPYSGVPASALGMDDSAWQEISWKLRCEHESMHYCMRRWLGSMRNNLWDELLADYAAIVTVLGHFRSDWLLHFWGLENSDRLRVSGRMKNYLTEGAFPDGTERLLEALVRRAGMQLEAMNKLLGSPQDLRRRWRLFQGLCGQPLELLASPRVVERISEWMARADRSANDSPPQTHCLA